jgi:hypothetical protein
MHFLTTEATAFKHSTYIKVTKLSKSWKWKIYKYLVLCSTKDAAFCYNSQAWTQKVVVVQGTIHQLLLKNSITSGWAILRLVIDR